MTAPHRHGKLSSPFCHRLHVKKTIKQNGVRSWFRSSLRTDGDKSTSSMAGPETNEHRKITEDLASRRRALRVTSSSCDSEVRWTSNAHVEEHYAALGWAVVPTVHDGNSLFRAISDQLYSNELFHQDIRRRLVAIIENDHHLFQLFVHNTTVQEYCAQMRHDGKQGGRLELYAAAKLFNIHIVVHAGPTRRLRVASDDLHGPKKQNPLPPYRTLHLLYKDEHYSSLQYPSANKYSSKEAIKFQKSKELFLKYENIENDAFLYEEDAVPEFGAQLPKQVLFTQGKRRESGATLFTLVHIPPSVPMRSETSFSSNHVTATASRPALQVPTALFVLERPLPKAPTLRAVPVEFPNKIRFCKGRVAAT
ncbi:hypothetical protein CCR75_003642 [Bremia lactucae]|uniref:OTU domain-containing protein n=1 Tax=Bremia lactucae TaxID=4779 RepID=A0A976NZK8_BRELC|nr:hypothetical protein CCR75_003642 [Bremia lactucae]